MIFERDMATTKERVQPESLAEASALLRNMASEQDSDWENRKIPVPALESLLQEEKNDNDEQLPLYTLDEENIEQRLQELATELSAEGDITLPLTSYTQISSTAPIEERRRLSKQQRIISTYFDAIQKANLELLSLLLSLNLISPETTNAEGLTPLLAAIKAGRSSSVKLLLDSGAQINAYGITETTTILQNRELVDQHTHRTPLQYAAETGNFALVKLLMNNGADDALIAPDGQLALRLAASNNHRDIVEFLPARRGGGFRRWKAKHATAMRRAKRAVTGIYHFGKFFAWDVPKFFVWSIPKHVLVLPACGMVKWLREHWKDIPQIMEKKAQSAWAGVKRVPKALLKFVKGIPGFVKEVAQEIGSLIKSCVKATWGAIKKLPNAVKRMLVWCWDGLKYMVLAVAHVFERLFSFLHTMVMAAVGFFQRITLQDVYRGFVTCLHAIFVDLPKTLWKWTCAVGKGIGTAFIWVFGSLGMCIWWMIKGIFEIVVYVPKKLIEVVKACGSSMKSGGKEVMVWLDPKRV